MAKKSKTQRAKASAARAARREQAREEEAAAAEAKKLAEARAAATEAPKKRLFKRSEKSAESAADGNKQEKAQSKSVEKKSEKKPAVKKRRFGFLKDVRAELKRVTWPTKQDVFRWSIVVTVALLFFGVFTYAFDNISTIILMGISSLGA